MNQSYHTRIRSVCLGQWPLKIHTLRICLKYYVKDRSSLGDQAKGWKRRRSVWWDRFPWRKCTAGYHLHRNTIENQSQLGQSIETLEALSYYFNRCVVILDIGKFLIYTVSIKGRQEKADSASSHHIWLAFSTAHLILFYFSMDGNGFIGFQWGFHHG